MLHLTSLAVHFGDRTLFEGVDLAIGNKDRIGLVGRNGAGKSTLLKIIAGLQKPSGGSVNTPKEYRIGYLPQEMEHEEESTVMEVAMQAFAEVQALETRLEALTEEVAERTDYESDSYADLIQELSDANERLDAIGASSTEEQAHRILQGLGFKITDMTRQMSEFSGGWKMRVELAKLLLMQPDLLLLDEPTNHLDIESIEWLESFLMHHPGAILLISHDRVFLDTLTKRTVEIGGVKLYDYKGPYSAYQVWREEERSRQEQAAKNQQKYIQETEVLINKFRAKKNKAAFAQSLIKKLDKLERVEVDAAENMQIRFRFPPAPRSGKVIFEAKTLKKCFDDLTVFEGLDFIMARQEKVALVGKNGAGKNHPDPDAAGARVLHSRRIDRRPQRGHRILCPEPNRRTRRQPDGHGNVGRSCHRRCPQTVARSPGLVLVFGRRRRQEGQGVVWGRESPFGVVQAPAAPLQRADS